MSYEGEDPRGPSVDEPLSATRTQGGGSANAHGTALVVVPQVLMPVSPQDAKAAMDAYQAITAAILEPSDWQGRPGASGSFVKKSGWRKIAKSYRLSTEVLERSCVHDADGNPLRAEAVVRAIHTDSGQYADADGYCAADEARFSRSGGRAKIENDLRATATTRAKNRAIADLVGMGAVSAEEVDASLAAGPMMRDPQAVVDAIGGVARYIGLDRFGQQLPEAFGRATVEWIVDQHGYLPAPVGRALIKLQRQLALAMERSPGEGHEPETEPAADDPQDTPPEVEVVDAEPEPADDTPPSPDE